MKALVLSSLFLLAVVGTAMAQTPTVVTPVTPVATSEPTPDFSYLWMKPTGEELVKAEKSYDLHYREEGGVSDRCAPYLVPVELQKAFEPFLAKTWKSWFDPQNKKYAPSTPENLSNFRNGFQIYKEHDLVLGKELFILKMWCFFMMGGGGDYALAVFDPRSKSCTKEPIELGAAQLDFEGKEDVLGDGGRELKFGQGLENGSFQKSNVRYYAIEKDLSLKEVFAYTKFVGNMPEEKSYKFDPKDPKWKEKIKNFDPVKEEQNLRALSF